MSEDSFERTIRLRKEYREKFKEDVPIDIELWTHPEAQPTDDDVEEAIRIGQPLRFNPPDPDTDY